MPCTRTPPPDQVHNFAALTPARASQLAGRPARFRLAVEGTGWEHEGRTLYECRSGDGLMRTAWLDLDPEEEEGATLRVLHHPARVGEDGTRFEGFTEYRPSGAWPSS